MEATTEDEVADGHTHDWRDKDDLPGQLRDHHDGQEGGDEEEDGNDDARHVVIQAGTGVLEDGVAVEDHDVEPGEVQDDVHGDGDEEGLEDGRLQEVVDGDLVLQCFLYFSLDLGNLPVGENHLNLNPDQKAPVYGWALSASQPSQGSPAFLLPVVNLYFFWNLRFPKRFCSWEITL